MPSTDWSRVAREMVAALRGSHPRSLFSRRLGYRTNVVSDWEAGRRYPTAAELLRACELRRIDVDAAFRRFHPATAARVRADGRFALDRWLDALRGRTSVQLIADRSGLSRFAIARWLRGQARPRIHELLRVVDAITDRGSDLADALVGIENLPTLLEQHRRRASAKRLAFELPESEAVLRVMETVAYKALPRHRAGALAEALGITREREEEVLLALQSAGVLEWADARYNAREALTVDTSAEPAALNELRAHWSRVALERLSGPREEDWFGYNLMSFSDADLEHVREILRHAYREIRALAAASEPVEAAALLNLQLVTFARVRSE